MNSRMERPRPARAPHVSESQRTSSTTVGMPLRMAPAIADSLIGGPVPGAHSMRGQNTARGDAARRGRPKERSCRASDFAECTGGVFMKRSAGRASAGHDSVLVVKQPYAPLHTARDKPIEGSVRNDRHGRRSYRASRRTELTGRLSES